MHGPNIDLNAAHGFAYGVSDSFATINSTVNNQVLTEFAILIIGFAVVIAWVIHFVKSHRHL